LNKRIATDIALIDTIETADKRFIEKVKSICGSKLVESKKTVARQRVFLTAENIEKWFPEDYGPDTEKKALLEKLVIDYFKAKEAKKENIVSI
jgi:hypothetical protein